MLTVHPREVVRRACGPAALHVLRGGPHRFLRTGIVRLAQHDASSSPKGSAGAEEAPLNPSSPPKKESDQAEGAREGTRSPTERRFSVLPHRTSLTSRLWCDRFDKNNDKYRKLKERMADQGGKLNMPSHRHLTLKRMSDSFLKEQLPFKSNANVREEYINCNSSIRIAKLLEDLDAMAGSIAYIHCDDPSHQTLPLTIVTASMDRIDLLKRPTVEMDAQFSGKVTHVGHSSMEITIDIQEGNDTPGDVMLRSRFTMVARDPITNKAVQVNPLIAQNDEEKRLFNMGAALKARKKQQADMALSKAPPTPEERLVIHNLWLESNQYVGRDLPEHMTWMGDTKMQTVQVTQPQDRNIHGFVFGGTLMRQAFDLAYATACLYSKSHASFLAMDDVWFRKPVPIGSVLSFNSQVVYSTVPVGSSFQIMVSADVIDPLTSERETTNTFHFTFTSLQNKSAKVLPQTYGEAMLYLEGKRKWETGYEMAKENNSSVLEEWR